MFKNKRIKYVDSVPFEDRKKECDRITAKYESRVPVIVETSGNLPQMTKNKYLIPSELNMSQFMHVIRKRLKVTSEKGIFVTINGLMIPGTITLGRIRDQHKSLDGFTYATISEESVFGSGVDSN